MKSVLCSKVHYIMSLSSRSTIRGFTVHIGVSCLANKHHREISYNHAHEMVYFEMYMMFVGEKNCLEMRHTVRLYGCCFGCSQHGTHSALLDYISQDHTDTHSNHSSLHHVNLLQNKYGLCHSQLNFQCWTMCIYTYRTSISDMETGKQLS